MTGIEVDDTLTGDTVELLRQMIRNECVNDGTPGSGHEIRNADLLAAYLEGSGLDVETFEPIEGRRSIVARLEGSDAAAPTICLMGHTDVVPASDADWREDPFAGEIIDGEVWGRGAIDMLNMTASMAVVTRHLATSGFSPRGTLIFFGVADEEAGGTYGADWMTESRWDAVACDYVLTENGGYLYDTPTGPRVILNAGEKGIGWRRLTVRGTAAHGSMPFGADNALITAAEVVRRLAAHRPTPQVTQMWDAWVRAMGLDDELERQLLDPGALRDALEGLPAAEAKIAHALTHLTCSPNVAHGGTKTNSIPERVDLDVDFRTLPGQTDEDVETYLRDALGDLRDRVEVEPERRPRPASASSTDTPMWDLLTELALEAHPQARVMPGLIVGGTDASFFRERGVPAYGAGLFSRRLTFQEMRSRFHGPNERVDLESLGLTTRMWVEIARRMLG